MLWTKQRRFDVELGVIDEIGVQSFALLLRDLGSPQRGTSVRDAPTVIWHLSGNPLLCAMEESGQHAIRVRQKRRIERSTNRSRDRSGVCADCRHRLQFVLDGIADDVHVKSLKRRPTQLGEVTSNRRTLGRRVGKAEQTEGTVRWRIGQMELKLLERGAQHGVQNHEA